MPVPIKYEVYMRLLFATMIVFLSSLAVPTLAQETSAASTAGVTNAQTATPVRRFNICEEPQQFNTSAAYLQYTARCAFSDATDGSEEALRVALIEDIYIKASSYSFMNKAFFALSLSFALLVLIWPSLMAYFRAEPAKKMVASAIAAADNQGPEAMAALEKMRDVLSRIVGIASMQTTVTALAALCFAFYAHYKDKQTTSEGLMRTVLYAQVLDQPLIDEVITQMGTMDRGFGFAKALPSIAKANDVKPD
jgi:hypothetical protein